MASGTEKAKATVQALNYGWQPRLMRRIDN